MANIVMTPSKSNTAGTGISSMGATRQGSWEAFIDIAEVLSEKGSALAAGDLIQSFDIPAQTNIVNGQIKIIEAVNASVCTLNFGTNANNDAWIQSVDATATGYGTPLGAAEFFTTADTLDVNIATLTGTLTTGKIWVCVTWEYLGCLDSEWPS